MKTLEEVNHYTENKNRLAKEYMTARKNIIFKEMTDTLNLPDEELMKYTSMLEDSSIEYEHCKNCKNLLECKNAVIGFCYLPRVSNNQLIFEYQACKYQKKLEMETKHLDYISLFDMTKEIKNAKMKNIYMNDKSRFDAIKWITNFINEYPNKKKGLYLYGNFGCGKTYLIAAMFNELARKKVRSAIVFWPEFLRDLKASFGTDFKEKFEQVKHVSLLLLDDIGAESSTAWGRDEVLGPILQYRMQEGLPTFFTSNLTLEELEHHFSVSNNGVDEVKARRIMERIKQLAEPRQMISKNLRK